MSKDADSIRQKFVRVGQLAETKWGVFRRFISANPLSGFWIGVVLGGSGEIVRVSRWFFGW